VSQVQHIDPTRPPSLFKYQPLDLNTLNPLLGPIQRMRLHRARARYEELLKRAPQEQNFYGANLLTGDESQISDCAAELLLILKPR
jgi:hypothetical protein